MVLRGCLVMHVASRSSKAGCWRFLIVSYKTIYHLENKHKKQWDLGNRIRWFHPYLLTSPVLDRISGCFMNKFWDIQPPRISDFFLLFSTITTAFSPLYLLVTLKCVFSSLAQYPCSLQTQLLQSWSCSCGAWHGGKASPTHNPYPASS